MNLIFPIDGFVVGSVSSPDLKRFNFYLFAYLKTLLYLQITPDKINLQKCVYDVWETIMMQAEIFIRISQCMNVSIYDHAHCITCETIRISIRDRDGCKILIK